MFIVLLHCFWHSKYFQLMKQKIKMLYFALTPNRPHIYLQDCKMTPPLIVSSVVHMMYAMSCCYNIVCASCIWAVRFPPHTSNLQMTQPEGTSLLAFLPDLWTSKSSHSDKSVNKRESLAEILQQILRIIMYSGS